MKFCYRNGSVAFGWLHDLLVVGNELEYYEVMPRLLTEKTIVMYSRTF
jgi:hypothetical protein